MSVHIRNIGKAIRGGATALTLSASLAGLAVPAVAKTLTAEMQSPLRALDPIVSTAAITNTHGFMIYDTLLGMDANFDVKPQMADWNVSDDGKTYTFTLRDGLLWHDGTPVTSEDCIASIKRWGAKDVMGQSLMALVTEMKAIDDKVFSISFEVPTSMILLGLAKIGTRTAFMMPKQIAETPASEQITEYVGSGPFRFVENEFQPGVKVVYEKNEAYVPRQDPASWTSGGKVVTVDRVEWVAMPDKLTGVNALLNDEVDYIENLPFDLMPMVESNSDYEVKLLNPLGLWTYMRFNFLYPPFDNELVRRAAMYAVGQNDVLTALTGDPKFFKTCVAIFGCGTPYASDYGTDIIVESNIEKAKELLAEAGYKGEKIIILHPTDNVQVSTQPVVVADALRKAGFNVDLQSMDWQSVAARRAIKKPLDDGGWSIHITTGPLIGITNPLINQTVATSGDNAWFGWPDFPDIEALRSGFARTTDPVRLKDLALEIQNKVIDDGVVVPLGQFVIPAGYSKKLTGVLESPVAVFWNIDKAE